MVICYHSDKKKLIQRPGFWHSENMIAGEDRVSTFEMESSTFPSVLFSSITQPHTVQPKSEFGAVFIPSI